MILLTLKQVLHIGQRVLGEVQVREMGLLAGAVARPATTVFGEDAYPGLHEKAAAVLHSIARNHPLVDGNKRLAFTATVAFYGLNGYQFGLTNDEAYELVVAVASGKLDDVPTIAERLAESVEPWDPTTR